MKANFVNPINGRYYFMLVSEDLFGQTEILVSRGSTHRPKAIIRYLAYSNIYEAMRDFYKLACLRIKHGYVEKELT